MKKNQKRIVQAKPTSRAASRPYPEVFDRYVDHVGTDHPDAMPRRVTKKFHGMEITGWVGRVHISDVEGYVENKRLKFYLNRWRSTQGDPNAVPSTQQMYEIMLEADAEEEREEKKIFYLERLARSIVRNGVQEEIIVFLNGKQRLALWDGNRRFFATYHIMQDDGFKNCRENVQWMPCFLIETSGDKELDQRRRHAILTETNFVKKDAISWPTYIKAEEIWEQFEIRTQIDPTDLLLAREVKGELAQEYGLYSKGKPSWRQVDRWIKMVNLAQEFKEYQEEDKQKDQDTVDLRVADCFEYFDELSKPKVKDVLDKDPEKRDEVFDWLWDSRFPSFAAVRKVPNIYEDPVALSHMRSGDPKHAFENAATALAANDPNNIKDKRAAAAKIDQFAKWLDSFKREDFHQLNAESLKKLKQITIDITNMLEGLLKPKRNGRAKHNAH
jgi:hypothetical protein